MVLKIESIVSKRKRKKRLFTLILAGLLVMTSIAGIFPNSTKGANQSRQQDDVKLENAVDNNISKVQESKKSMSSSSSEWLLETIESSESTGWVPSLAVDSNGYPHIAYWDQSDEDLRYARWNGSTWIKRTVNIDTYYNPTPSLVLDSDDNPHIAYQRGLQLRYGWYDSDYNWHGTTVVDNINYTVDHDTSLGLDNEKDPHIAYYTSNDEAIRYAYRDDGGSWHKFQVLWGNSYSGDFSLAMGTDDFPKISFYDTENNELIYLNGYSYEGDLLEYTLDTIDSSGNVGKYNSIETDSDGYATISYYDLTNGNLKMAYEGPNDWSTVHADWDGDVGSQTSVALDDAGNPHVSYQNNDNHSLKYGRKETGFLKETVDDSISVGASSLALGKNGHPRIAYYDQTNEDLKYAVEGAPSEPPFLIAGGGDNEVDLWWGSPDDEGGRNLTGYNIYRGTTSGGESYLTSVDDSTTTYTDTGVTNGNKYYYYVTAENMIGESPQSMEANATASTDNHAPSKPHDPYPDDGAFLTSGQTSTTLMVDVRDPDGDSMDVTFYSFFGEIGTDTGVPSGDIASVTYDNLLYNATYSWYAVADDGVNKTYSDWFQFNTDDPYEDNEGHLAAYNISGNETTWLSNMESKGRQADQDWYEISITSGYQYIHARTTFTHGDGDIELRLYNSTGFPLASSDSWTDNETIHYKVESSGTYYLRVSGQHEGNLYDLWWDDKNTPLPPENPKPADGSKAKTDPSLNVTVYDGSGDDMEVTFYDAADDTQIGSVSNVASGDTAEVQWTGLQERKTYEWYVTASGDTDTVESPTWSFTTNSVPNKPDNLSPDDGAIGVSLNPTLSANVSDPDGDSMDVQFVDTDTSTVIGYDWDVQNDTTTSVTWNDLSPGTTYNWYVHADDGYDWNMTSTYSFTTDDTYEENDNRSSAYNIMFNETEWLSTINGSGAQADDDWYQIYVSDNYEHVIANCVFNHSEGDINLSLYNSTGTLITSSYSTDDNETIDHYVNSGGIYYLKVYWGDQGNSYDLWWDDMAGTPDAPYNPSPSDGATGVTTSPTLSVDVSDPDGDSMNVSFYDASDDSQIGSTQTEVPDGGTASVTWSGLSYDTTYDWYAVADDGSHTNTSSTWSFTTETEPNNPPDAPTNPSPSDEATDVGTSPTLSVDVSDPDGDSMDVSFYDASDDSQIGSTQTGIADGGTASVTWPSLSYDTNYDWYAEADDGQDPTQSSTWSFTTETETNNAPDAPHNPSPSDGATGVSTSPSLSVDASDPDGDTMDVTFYDASDDSIIGSNSGVSNGTTSVTWSGLSYDTTYDWYAVADDGQDSIQSSTWSFTTRTETNNAPDAPTNPSPADSATDVGTSPTLSVDVFDPNGDSMDVSFYDASDDSQIGSTQTGIADGGRASVTWSSLSYDTTYDWYTVADDGQDSTQSSTWSFTTETETNNAPDAPHNPSPSDGATGVSTSPSLSVDASDPDGESVNVTFYNASDNSEIDTLTGVQGWASVTWFRLSPGTTYEWYAEADDGSLTSQSEIWSFTTAAEANYDVSVTAPADEKLSKEETTLSFTVNNNGEDETTYDIDVSTSGSEWTVTSDSDSKTIKSGESKTVDITLTVPSSASDGDTTEVSLTATSENDDSVTSTDTVEVEYTGDEDGGSSQDILSNYWWAILTAVIIIASVLLLVIFQKRV